jgi:dTDP-4-dehydrorhamnose reductase
MRVLVVGAGGQVGTELLSCFPDDDVIAARRSDADLTDPVALQHLVRSARPNLIVNAAAMTAVDLCEGQPELAMAVNAVAVGVLAELAAEQGAHLTTISTDYVFDGTKHGPYVESDPVNPLSVYGRSKLEGERLAGSDSTIVRTSWVCSRTVPNMLLTVLRLLEGATTLRFVDDQFGCPTFAGDLAAMVARLSVDRVTGPVHVTNQGSVSWFEFAREIAIATGRNADRVGPVSSAELDPPRQAPRPSNSVLASEVLPAVGLPLLRDFRLPLREVLEMLGS